MIGSIRRSLTTICAAVCLACGSSLLAAAVTESADEFPADSTGERDEPDAEGFAPIFNGKDLSGWTGHTEGYHADDGALACKPGGLLLHTKAQYTDFVFRFEFQLTPAANSGIGIRYLPPFQPMRDMEIQILDDTAAIYKDLKSVNRHGAVYGAVAAKHGHLKPVGQWNSQEIVARGSRITVTLNGTVILDARLDAYGLHPELMRERGHIAILGHGSPMKFRKLRVKESVPAPGEVADAQQIADHSAVAHVQSLTEEVMQPFDPLARVRWALEGFMTRAPKRLPGAEGYYRAVFDSFVLLDSKAQRDHGQWDLGDCTARAIMAWIAIREMTGDRTTGAEVERGQREFLLTMLHPETGLVWFAADKEKGTYHSHTWDQGRTLRALVRWYETKPSDRRRLKPLIERMIAGLDRCVTTRGTDEKWGPYGIWPSSVVINGKPGSLEAEPHFCNVCGGIFVEPLVMYAELTDDPRAVQLAKVFTSAELGGHQGDVVAARRPFKFNADGSFGGHLHSKTATLVGVAKLARYLASHGQMDQARPYFRFLRKSYEWLFDEENRARGSRIGFIPEHPGGGNHETCCVADVIELAEVMASCAQLDPELHDWAALHDDVQSMLVNVVARVQLKFTPTLEKVLAGYYGTDAAQHLATARCFDGVCLATFVGNDMIYNNGGKPCMCVGGCCQYAGVRALYSGWRDAMTWNDGRLRINSFLNRQSSRAVMTTGAPIEGKATIALREAAEVLIRVPARLTLQQMAFRVDGSYGYHSQFAKQAEQTGWVQVDLGQVKPIEVVVLHPADPDNFRPRTPGFGFPVRFRIDVSNDRNFQNCTTIADFTKDDYPNPGNRSQEFACEKQVSARYVRLSATRLWKLPEEDKHALAMAEMQVFSAGKNVAEDRMVFAGDSIETSIWGKGFLVDGHCRGELLPKGREQ